VALSKEVSVISRGFDQVDSELTMYNNLVLNPSSSFRLCRKPFYEVSFKDHIVAGIRDRLRFSVASTNEFNCKPWNI
jgi:hypothetical protein